MYINILINLYNKLKQYYIHIKKKNKINRKSLISLIKYIMYILKCKKNILKNLFYSGKK